MMVVVVVDDVDLWENSVVKQEVEIDWDTFGMGVVIVVASIVEEEDQR
jgi:hypothetical protein